MLWLALALGLAPSVVPEADGVRVQWSGPPQCSDASAAQVSLDAVLGGPRPDLHARARVDVSGADARWVARVTVEHEQRTVHRTVRGEACDVLAEAVALIVAVTVDPLGSSASITRAIESPKPEPEPEPEPAPAPEPVPQPEPTTDPTGAERPAGATTPPDVDEGPPNERARSPRRRPTLAAGLIAGGGGTLGLLPQIGGRLEGGAVLEIGRARLELTAGHRFGTDIPHPEQPSSGARVTFTHGRASACWSITSTRVRFPLCGGIELGQVTAEGFGLASEATPRSLWIAVTPQVRPTLRATRWLGVGLDVQAPVALSRPRFAIDDFERDLVRIGGLGLRFGLVIELLFSFSDEDSDRRASG